MADADAASRFNFAAVSVLLLEQSAASLDILEQMFFGFGVRQCHKSTTVEEATDIVRRKTLDLIALDPNLKEGDGLKFVKWLRHSGLDPNRSIPVLVLSANGASWAVEKARDAGVSYFLVKPVAPAALLDRILHAQRDRRAFIVSDTYVGPDRRFKFEGPPPGVAPRRSSDLKGALGDAVEPNLSQDDLDAMFKPQRVVV